MDNGAHDPEHGHEYDSDHEDHNGAPLKEFVLEGNGEPVYACNLPRAEQFLDSTRVILPEKLFNVGGSTIIPVMQKAELLQHLAYKGNAPPAKVQAMVKKEWAVLCKELGLVDGDKWEEHQHDDFYTMQVKVKFLSYVASLPQHERASYKNNLQTKCFGRPADEAKIGLRVTVVACEASVKDSYFHNNVAADKEHKGATNAEGALSVSSSIRAVPGCRLSEMQFEVIATVYSMTELFDKYGDGVAWDIDELRNLTNASPYEGIKRRGTKGAVFFLNESGQLEYRMRCRAWVANAEWMRRQAQNNKSFPPAKTVLPPLSADLIKSRGGDKSFGPFDYQAAAAYEGADLKPTFGEASYGPFFATLSKEAKLEKFQLPTFVTLAPWAPPKLPGTQNTASRPCLVATNVFCPPGDLSDRSDDEIVKLMAQSSLLVAQTVTIIKGDDPTGERQSKKKAKADKETIEASLYPMGTCTIISLIPPTIREGRQVTNYDDEAALEEAAANAFNQSSARNTAAATRGLSAPAEKKSLPAPDTQTQTQTQTQEQAPAATKRANDDHAHEAEPVVVADEPPKQRTKPVKSKAKQAPAVEEADAEAATVGAFKMKPAASPKKRAKTASAPKQAPKSKDTVDSGDSDADAAADAAEAEAMLG